MKSRITTFTKIDFDALAPRSEDMCMADIAHALSMMTRANGHYPEFFSVGQHSIQCCKEALARNYSGRVAMACLLHDASEAYIADITRSVKNYMTMYLQIEDQLQTMLYEKYLGSSLEEDEAGLVDQIDDACLYYEFDHYMGIKMAEMQPLIVSDLKFEFSPMADVEKEFNELYARVAKMIEDGR